MEKIEYNKDTLDILKSLSSLSKALIIRKIDNGEKISIKSGDISSFIMYHLEAPVNHFNFKGDECAFYEYPDFHDLMSILDECDMHQNGDIITLVSDKTKIKYLTSEAELIKNEWETIPESDTVGSFKLDFEALKKINKLKSSIKAKSLKIKLEKNEIKFVLFSKENENMCEEIFMNEIDNLDDYEFLLSTEIFDKLPLANYEFNITESGILKVKMLLDDIDLWIYTGEIIEDV
jgi:hypothetical protein